MSRNDIQWLVALQSFEVGELFLKLTKMAGVCRVNLKAQLCVCELTRHTCDSISGLVAFMKIRKLYIGATVKGYCQDCLPAHSLKYMLWNSCGRKHESQKGNAVVFEPTS